MARTGAQSLLPLFERHLQAESRLATVATDLGASSGTGAFLTGRGRGLLAARRAGLVTGA